MEGKACGGKDHAAGFVLGRQSWALDRLKPFFADLTHRIGKIAVQREGHILCQGIDAVMFDFNLTRPARDLTKGLFQLREITHFNGDVKFAKRPWPQSQFPARQPPADNQLA
jgi:hypothetical protein